MTLSTRPTETGVENWVGNILIAGGPHGTVKRYPDRVAFVAPNRGMTVIGYDNSMVVNNSGVSRGVPPYTRRGGRGRQRAAFLIKRMGLDQGVATSFDRCNNLRGVPRVQEGMNSSKTTVLQEMENRAACITPDAEGPVHRIYTRPILCLNLFRLASLPIFHQ